MQREPVPAGLVGGERLAAPFAVHPGLARDIDRLVVDGKSPAYLEEGLAVVIRGLPALGFAAVAAIALQHQWAVGRELECVGEILGCCGEYERSDGVGIGIVRPAHLPGIDEGVKRTCLDTSLTDTAACKTFAEAMGVGAGGCRM